MKSENNNNLCLMNKTILIFFAGLIIGLIISGCNSSAQNQNIEKTESVKISGDNAMKLTSTAFSNKEMIPTKYTCDGNDISPPLNIEGVPENAKALALITDDPDAPVETFTHWVVYNIPASTKQISENQPHSAQLPNGSLQGKNSFGKLGFGGPCPPSGTHRYFFKLYALDTSLNLEPKADKKDLESAMNGHIISKTELVGLYKR